MPITPAGYPAWSRTASFESYGGNVNKRDYGGQGAINPYTDVSASQFSRMVSDIAAITRTAAFGEMTVLCNDTVPGVPTIEVVELMTGVRTSSYAGGSAPTGFPSGARNGNGHTTITFASDYTDEYGIQHALSIFGAHATAHATSGVHRNATVELVGQTIVVRVTNDAGAAVSDARFTLEIW